MPAYQFQSYWYYVQVLKIWPPVGHRVGHRVGHGLPHVLSTPSVAFVSSTALDVHFKCCISADAKIQASIKHGTEVKPIHRTTWFHSSLPCSFRDTWRSHFSAINRHLKYSLLLVFKFGHIAHNSQVPNSHQASSSTGFSCQKHGKWKLTTCIFS